MPLGPPWPASVGGGPDGSRRPPSKPREAGREEPRESGWELFAWLPAGASRRRCPDVAGHILRESGIWEGLRVTQIMSDTFARGLHAAASARRWRLSGADGAICWSLVVTAVGVPLACWPWPLAPVFCSTINTVSGIDLPSKEKSLAWCSVWRAGPGAERARSRRPRPRPSSGAAEARGLTAG